MKQWPLTRPTRSETQEALVHLYLRLNGYLTSGFIVHSHERGKNLTEVDTVAVRHPHHAEPVQVIPPSPFLEPSDSLIDLIICEVKTSRASLQFNEALRKDPKAVETVVQWVGLFEAEALGRVLPRLRDLLKPDCPAKTASAGVVEGNVRVRALLCAPEIDLAEGDPWLLHRSEILTYVHDRLNRPREYSSIRYSLRSWGPWLEPLVTYFKALGTRFEPDIEDLYRFVGATGIREATAPGI